MSKESGDGNQYEAQWFYSKDDGTCRRFYYSGTGGNQNRFETEQECKTICADHASKLPYPFYFFY